MATSVAALPPQALRRSAVSSHPCLSRGDRGRPPADARHRPVPADAGHLQVSDDAATVGRGLAHLAPARRYQLQKPSKKATAPPPWRGLLVHIFHVKSCLAIPFRRMATWAEDATVASSTRLTAKAAAEDALTRVSDCDWERFHIADGRREGRMPRGAFSLLTALTWPSQRRAGATTVRGQSFAHLCLVRAFSPRAHLGCGGVWRAYPARCRRPALL